MTTLRKRVAAFTLVELMIVVMIIGVLAAVAIPAFSSYIKKSRTPEQAQMLNKLWVGSVSYYQTDHMNSNNTANPKQFPGPSAMEPLVNGNHCGCLASRKCPGMSMTAVDDPIFQALNFSQPDPHIYLARYTGSGTGTASRFTAEALGDVDCDSTISSYIRKGAIEGSQGDVTGQNTPFAVNEGE